MIGQFSKGVLHCAPSLVRSEVMVTRWDIQPGSTPNISAVSSHLGMWGPVWGQRAAGDMPGGAEQGLDTAEGGGGLQAPAANEQAS